MQIIFHFYLPCFHLFPLLKIIYKQPNIQMIPKEQWYTLLRNRWFLLPGIFKSEINSQLIEFPSSLKLKKYEIRRGRMSFKPVLCWVLFPDYRKAYLSGQFFIFFLSISIYYFVSESEILSTLQFHNKNQYLSQIP